MNQSKEQRVTDGAVDLVNNVCNDSLEDDKSTSRGSWLSESERGATPLVNV